MKSRTRRQFLREAGASGLSLVALPGWVRSFSLQQYAPDLMEEDALRYISENMRSPFFLFFTTTIPHLALQVPDDSLREYMSRWDDPPYAGKKGYLPQQHPRATYAAMVSRLDRTVGRISRKLHELQIEENTLVIFTSDNGSTFDIGGYDPSFFNGTGSLRAHKGYLYEGGIRIPLHLPWNFPSRRLTDDYLTTRRRP